MRSRRYWRIISTLPVFFLSPACPPGGQIEGREGVADARTSIEDPTGAQRIVSLSRMTSLMLLELDAADRIVAVDATSATIPALQGRPQLAETASEAIDAIRDLRPDLVVVPARQGRLAKDIQAQGIAALVVDVHDFDDGFELWNELAVRIGLAVRAHSRIRDVSRPLAEISAASLGWSRPRVAALADSAPITLVGAHAFDTALIEIAGGENVTHGRDEATIVVGLEALRALQPELVVKLAGEPLSKTDRDAIEDAIAGLAPVVFLDFDRDHFYGAQTIATAEQLHALIRERSARLPAKVR